MQSRDRVKRLLNRKPTDRVPNGLGGCETAGLHNLAYDKLKRILGVQDPRNRMCTFMCNAVFEPSVLEAMEADVILLHSRMCPSRFWGPRAAEEWKELVLWDTPLEVARDWDFRRDPDGAWWWGANMCPPGSIFFDPPAPPTSDRVFEGIERPSPDDFNPPHELPERTLKRLEEDARWLHENTPFSICCGETIQDLQVKLGGVHSWWMRMVEEPGACHEVLAKACEAGLAQLRQLDRAVGRYCDLLMIADDMGDARGVTVGPDLWREIYKPYYERLFTEWHNITDMRVSLHSCGAISDILPDLIECGVDVYNPAQISAANMEPADLKRKCGDDLIFYGGALDMALLRSQTPEEEVYEAVKRNVAALSRGGGYLLAGVHNLPGDVPESHLRAMLQAWRDCREDPALTGARRQVRDI